MAPPDVELRQRTSQGGVNGSDFLGGDLFVQTSLSVLPGLFDLCLVDIVSTNGHISHDAHTVAGYLNEALPNRQKILTPILAHNHFARHELRHKPDVVGKDTH